MEAVSLHCPNCGAAVQPDAQRCPYCQTRLATISCSSCFGLMFRGAEFCPHCGARADRHEDASATATCPGCGGEMHRVTLGAATMLDCTKCDGVWIDAKAFESLCANRESHAAVLERFKAKEVAPEPSIHYRKCLRCRKLMNRVNYGHLSGTVIDVCRGDGTFLDNGELHRIVSFIDAGGLDRARQKEMQELREEERRINMAKTNAGALGALPMEPAQSINGRTLLDFVRWIIQP